MFSYRQKIHLYLVNGISFFLLSASLATAQGDSHHGVAPRSRILHFPEETHFTNVRQLTFGGQNAEAYWSPDGTKLSYQASNDDVTCDQIFTMDANGGNKVRVSNGEGRTTCAYFLGDSKTMIYGSTHSAGAECPPKPDRREGYVWPLYNSYDIYRYDPATGDRVRLTQSPGYDAEATVSPDGKTIVFTSVRDGDLELYTMDSDGNNVKRITWRIGYDGGAFFSPDGKYLVYRAFHPRSIEELVEYRRLLNQGLYRPTWLEIFISRADGNDARAITDYRVASFAPSWFPDGNRILFASNLKGPRMFSIFAIDRDGTNLEQISFGNEFESFPLFSPDEKTLVFSSNRNGSVPRETNVFLADWVK